MECLKHDSVLLAIITAKSKEEREAVIEKYGKVEVGKMLLKLNYIKRELEMLKAEEEFCKRKNCLIIISIEGGAYACLKALHKVVTFNYLFNLEGLLCLRKLSGKTFRI
ncbi:hypothetical protein [Pelosinus propionicus]|uniref:Uncharacterized protein n=1 Tax=Pelosinus propionicus DSM 13327 TaxID=1123291 RepID=A0A1I4PL37_9FIRM|nr:hypothetical protein [Pelosinus propionicus]SFM28316.1 hypothetical protein SAMN04490355_106612 [Pelosinus propionicus DSM 13327]